MAQQFLETPLGVDNSSLRFNDDDRRRHVVIAGTGRAGTSFLVQFLNACGLGTGANEGVYLPRAQAGYEHSLLSNDELPYVVKDPWLSTYCEAIDLDTIAIDALIVPMRDLVTGAVSRILQERMAILETDWRHRPVSHLYATTPGGALHSLEAMDQARVLAVGFHNLLLWAASKEIPVYLLEFPRIVEDGRYLVRTLWPWLGSLCDEETAAEAFKRTADPTRVRVASRGQLSDGNVLIDLPSPADLDRAAMLLLLDERTANLASTRADLADAQANLAGIRADLAAIQEELDNTIAPRRSRFARLLRWIRKGLVVDLRPATGLRVPPST